MWSKNGRSNSIILNEKLREERWCLWEEEGRKRGKWFEGYVNAHKIFFSRADRNMIVSFYSFLSR